MRQNPNLTRKDHLLSFEDHTREETLKILELCKLIKDAHKQGVQVPLLKGKILGMLFFDASLRTRVSFEAAMAQLGGHAEFLQPKTLHVGGGNESMRDTAEVLSRMCDAILIRTEHVEVMNEFAKYSYCPVIEGGGLSVHPSQVVADVFTMMEHLPGVAFNDMTVMFMGDTNDEAYHFVPVQRSMMHICALLGITFVACSPKPLQACQADQDTFKRLAEENGSGAKMYVTDNSDDFIGQADFLVGEVFTFKGMQDYTGYTDEEFRKIRMDMLSPKYQINAELLKKAKPNVGVMHCMPGNRDEEITSEVWDGPNSLLFEEAENRLHAQKAICTWLMYKQERSKELQAYHRGRIEDCLNETNKY